MVVCMERKNCVALYEALIDLPNCPEIRIVMTGNLGEDPPEWSEKNYLTTKFQRESMKECMIDADDPLNIVIVCDMWLTGTDIPCLHTLYIDKPMHGHNMIQAISRVNRVFSDKPHGLVVDYIGIGDDLREATSHYTQGGGQGDVAAGIDESPSAVLRRTQGCAIRFAEWQEIRSMAWHDRNRDRRPVVPGPHRLSGAEDDTRDEFLQAEARLSSAFLLVKHLDDCRGYADEIIFYQRVRKQMLKIFSGGYSQRELDHAVQDLVDDSLEPQGVVDIFQAAGIPKPDISILDDAFLQTFKDHPPESLQVKLLEDSPG